MQEELLQIKDVLEILKLSKSTFYAKRKKEKSFPQPVKLFGECPRYRRSDILHYIEQLKS